MLRELQDQLADAGVSVVAINCMALSSVDALLERLTEEFRCGNLDAKRKTKKRKAKESATQTLDSLLSHTTRRW